MAVCAKPLTERCNHGNNKNKKYHNSNSNSNSNNDDMKTTKEGRGRTTPNEMPSKVGRLMFHDLMKSSKSGYSPFLEQSYLSKQFYNSRQEYTQMNFGSFQNHARRVATQVLAVMTDAEKKAEQARIARITKTETTNNLPETSFHDASHHKTKSIVECKAFVI